MTFNFQTMRWATFTEYGHIYEDSIRLSEEEGAAEYERRVKAFQEQHKTEQDGGLCLGRFPMTALTFDESELVYTKGHKAKKDGEE